VPSSRHSSKALRWATTRTTLSPATRRLSVVSGTQGCALRARCSSDITPSSIHNVRSLSVPGTTNQLFHAHRSGPVLRRCRAPWRLQTCSGGFRHARVGPFGLRGGARGRCRPRQERIAPTATPRPVLRRRKSARRRGSPCRCSTCCRRCFNTLPRRSPTRPRSSPMCSARSTTISSSQNRMHGFSTARSARGAGQQMAPGQCR
jgi:hypothetical protein